MPNGTCSIEGCGNQARCRGLCGKHYARYIRHGDPYYVERPEYTGDSYDAAHYRVEQARGKASKYTCAGCAVKRATDWAFDHRDSDPAYSLKGLPYSLSIDHYVPLCRTCHLRFDRLVTRMAAETTRPTPNR